MESFRHPDLHQSPEVLRVEVSKSECAVIEVGQQETMAQMDVQLQYAREHAQRLAAELHQAKRTKPIWRK